MARKELVSRAPAEWEPGPADRKLLMTMSAESTTLRPGAKLRYRVALKNVGRQEYPVYEDPSFLKDGSASLSSAFRVYIRFPGGTESQLPPPILSFERPAASERTEPSSLFVRLAPGETITSRAIPPGSGFRDLDTALRFDRPGRYALRVVFSDGESTVESNRLEFVVAERSGGR